MQIQETIRNSEQAISRQRMFASVLPVAAFGCFAAALLVFTRHLFLDDAFIHLRIAQNLAAHGFFSFNGDISSYSSSSPLYTSLLAFFWKLAPTIYLPKAIGIVVYVALFYFVANLVIRSREGAARICALSFLAVVSSPMAVRWLSDGMETGLVGLFALWLGRMTAYSYSRSFHFRPIVGCVMFALGLFTTLLRVEFAFLFACVGFAWFVSCISVRKDMTWERQSFWPSLYGAGGAVVGLWLIFLVFGNILPDTAVAKQVSLEGKSFFSSALQEGVDVAKAHASASFFGVAALIVWSISSILVCRSARARVFPLSLNFGLGFLVALIILRHQAVQGYRYFVFIEFFLIAFNIESLIRITTPRKSVSKHQVAFVTAAVFACVAWQWFDFTRLNIINAGRSSSFESFATGNLHDLAGKTGIAWDVGMIGFFSQGHILDPNGLVDGRRFAAMSKHNRLREISSNGSIDFVFANDDQLGELSPYVNTSGWVEIGRFEFPNFGGNRDTHHLLVRASARSAQTE